MISSFGFYATFGEFAFSWNSYSYFRNNFVLTVFYPPFSAFYTANLLPLPYFFGTLQPKNLKI